jgi:hypothetical protein
MQLFGGCYEERKLRCEDLDDLYSSPEIKLRRTGGGGHITLVRMLKYSYHVLVWLSEGKILLWRRRPSMECVITTGCWE